MNVFLSAWLVLAAGPVPDGQTVRLPVLRDTWFSNVGPEADGNQGGAPKLKLKSIQEMSLIDVDVTPLKGHVIKSAMLHLRSTGPPALQRVTVGSFGAEWVEGTSTNYEPQAGSSSHNHRRHPEIPWTIPGSDLCSVILGQGGTTWRMAEASAPDPQGWQSIAVDPAIVAARVAGVSHGFFLYDDTGTTWTRQGEIFTLQHFPNRFVMSRGSNRTSEPYLAVTLDGDDRSPPAAPTDLQAETAELPAGEAWVSWITPADSGAAGTIGFLVNVDGRELPRYLIPLPKADGDRVRMHLRDLGRSGGAVALAVRAVDGAGNISPSAEARLLLSDRRARPLPGKSSEMAVGPDVPAGDVSILDELDKVQPITGELIPPQPAGYLLANHLWSAAQRNVTLHAARNEFVGFQVLLRGPMIQARPTLTFTGVDGAKIGVEFGHYRHVATRKGPLPDPIEPFGRSAGEVILGQKSASLHAEIYVPHATPAGDYQGTLTLETDGLTRTFAVTLQVWDFTLPDSLSFLPEMNSYGLPENERDYYRLAHKHRTVLNRLFYSHNGKVHDGGAPGWDGKRLDWTKWDRRFGPYFDGSAFADLPRRGVPIEVFYLPMHENWPTPIDPNYNGDFWADRALTKEYRQAFVEVSRQTADHFNTRGWNQTFFQGFLNNKVDFKTKGWSRATSPWLLDEPANFQDFWALRYFGLAFHEGIREAAGSAKLVFRADISRPQWQRDSLDGLLDYNVVGGAMRKYHRIVLDRKAAEVQVVVEYGSSNAVEEANVQAVGWSLDAWSLGIDGVLPWQTIGQAESWKDADSLSLFYPARNSGGPIPSIRLKAYRRGQQDVEYLTLLAQQTGEPRWAIGGRVREALGLVAERKGSGVGGGEDAGLIQYSRLRPYDDWALRLRVGKDLDRRHIPARRRLVELWTPPRDPSGLGVGGYVSESKPVGK